MFSTREKQFHKGFSLLEVIIAIVLLIMVMSILFTITLGGIKNGAFTQHLADVTIITSQKATELFNGVAGQIKSIPTGQNQVGSIDPSEPATNYTDYLNESGCLIKKLSFQQPKVDELPIEPTKDGSGSVKSVSRDSKTGLGDIGNGDSGSTDNSTPLDCSKSSFTTNSTSLTPIFRRQWIIIKNKPKTGDITIGVILVNQANNSIIRSETLVKVDGSTKK